MKKLLLTSLTLIAFFTIIASTGCYYDNEETLYPQGVCDTADVRYSNQVVKILQNKCYDCHSNQTSTVSGSNVSWEGYANISTYLNISAGQDIFLKAINHEAGAPPMPKNRPKLSDCEIRTLEIWIANGFPNN